MEVRGWCQVSCSATLDLTFLRQGLSLSFELHDLTRLACQQAPGIFLSLMLQSWGSGDWLRYPLPSCSRAVWPLRWGSDVDRPCMSECSTVLASVSPCNNCWEHISDEEWMRAIITYWYRNTYLNDSLMQCLFSKIVVGVPPGPMSSLAMDSLLDLEYQTGFHLRSGTCL